MAKRQHALCNLIDLEQQIIVQLLEFDVQLEEVVALDIPVVATDIHVEDLIVGQKIIQGISKLRCYV